MAGPSLSLSQSQRLQMVLAPQLRQSLEILQMPMLDLRHLVQQEMEQNPTIEEVPEDVQQVEIEPGMTAEAAPVEPAEGGEDRPEGAPAAAEAPSDELRFDKEFEALAKLDDEWKDYFFQDLQTTSSSEEQNRTRQFFLDSLPQRESLQEHLMEQLNLSGLSEADMQIGRLVIGSINDDGYLAVPPAELASSVNCDPQHLDAVLAVVQDFHPSGIAARDLRDCLLLQLDRLGKGESLAAAIVRDHLDTLGAKRFLEISKALKVSIEDVKAAGQFISTLDPKPGRAYSTDVATYVTPEILVRKIEGEYVVILNDEQVPHVRISGHYRRLMEDKGTSPEVREYIQERVRSSAFLIKSIEQRQKTIQRIASEIVTTQTEFLDHGVSHLRPMTMADVARTVGVHETTVSRAVSGKYMQTPAGIFELKYFFTPGIRTASGQEISNKTVKDIIDQMVDGEDKANPLSDQEIMAKLKEQGIDIARRTVAKYRLILRIPPSHLRRET